MTTLVLGASGATGRQLGKSTTTNGADPKNYCPFAR